MAARRPPAREHRAPRRSARRAEASSRPASAGSCVARIAAASSAALTAPARPIASVPTGMPAGIWTMDNRLSMPFKRMAFRPARRARAAASRHAHMPGRCAAPPAPAMMHLQPAIPGGHRIRRADGRACGGRRRSAPHAARRARASIVGGMRQGRPVRLAAHDDPDQRRGIRRRWHLRRCCPGSAGFPARRSRRAASACAS